MKLSLNVVPPTVESEELSGPPYMHANPETKMFAEQQGI